MKKAFILKWLNLETGKVEDSSCNDPVDAIRGFAISLHNVTHAHTCLQWKKDEEFVIFRDNCSFAFIATSECGDPWIELFNDVTLAEMEKKVERFRRYNDNLNIVEDVVYNKVFVIDMSTADCVVSEDLFD